MTDADTDKPVTEAAGVRLKQVSGVGFQGGCGDNEELYRIHSFGIHYFLFDLPAMPLNRCETNLTIRFVNQ
jgi:hypothetical protein